MHKLLLILLAAVIFVQCRQAHQNPSSTSQMNETELPKIQVIAASYDNYGINADKFEVQNYRVKQNQSLYLLLQGLDLNQQQIYRAIQKAKKVIDVRSFKPSQRYRAYKAKKGNDLKKMVWQPNKLDFVTFSWQHDSLQISRASHILTTKTNQISGTIKSSLYNAMNGIEGRAKIVDKLSNILAWQVNFFGLRKGDSFKILYDNKFVDGHYFDVGRVRAIELTNMGDTYYAYHFMKGSIDGYYNRQGKSVQSALLKTPFKYDQRISSRFNLHRMHPILHRRRPHYGVDYAAPYGTPVLSVGDGTVMEAHYGGAAGNIVKIRHNRTYRSAYMHLSKFANGVHRGAHVKQGEVIGYVGNTGRVTGTHLHYSLYKNNHPVNPLKVKLPSSKSIPDSYRVSFEELRNHIDRELGVQSKSNTDSLQAKR